MHPEPVTPNEVEAAILERLARKEPSIKDSLGTLYVVNRKFTGAGNLHGP